MKRTKIVCTIGPASSDPKILEHMIKAGMNVARLNFSHGDYDSHTKTIQTIRAVSKKLDTPITILQDLQGPRIRLGELKKPIEIKDGSKVIFTTVPGKGKIPVTYEKLHKDLKVKHRILIADGVIELVVTKIQKTDIHTKVIHGGILESHKGMNFPDSKLSLSSLTQKDKEDIVFGVSQNVDWIAMSFVTSGKDVKELKKLIKKAENTQEHKPDHEILVMTKIEKHEAIQNIEDILTVTDGIMIARGDLGIEMPAEDVPIIQKGLIFKCLEKSKPVIVATQMLDSMIRNPRPTRAEVSDVANAVIDHTDAVMLSGESAMGKYPVQSVDMMRRIIEKTERSAYDDLSLQIQMHLASLDDSLLEIAKVITSTKKATALLVMTFSGKTARRIAKFRTELPIYVATTDERVMRQLNVSWGVIPLLLPDCSTWSTYVDCALEALKQKRKFGWRDKLVVIVSDPAKPGRVKMVKEVRF